VQTQSEGADDRSACPVFRKAPYPAGPSQFIQYHWFDFKNGEVGYVSESPPTDAAVRPRSSLSLWLTDLLLAYDTVKVCTQASPMSFICPTDPACIFVLKIVRIENWKLGLFHYSLMALIIAYTVGYDVIYQKRYVQVDNPVGSVRLSLRAPCAVPAYYCGAITPPANWTQSCQRTPPSQLPYCLQSGQTYPNSSWPNNQCRYYDDTLAVRFFR
jgi:hypothetical protein